MFKTSSLLQFVSLLLFVSSSSFSFFFFFLFHRVIIGRRRSFHPPSFFFLLLFHHLFSPSSFSSFLISFPFFSLSFIRYSLNSTAIIVVIIMIIILATIPKVINPTGSPSSLSFSSSSHFPLHPLSLSHHFSLTHWWNAIVKLREISGERERERDGHVIRWWFFSCFVVLAE